MCTGKPYDSKTDPWFAVGYLSGTLEFVLQLVNDPAPYSIEEARTQILTNITSALDVYQTVMKGISDETTR